MRATLRVLAVKTLGGGEGEGDGGGSWEAEKDRMRKPISQPELVRKAVILTGTAGAGREEGGGEGKGGVIPHDAAGCEAAEARWGRVHRQARRGGAGGYLRKGKTRKGNTQGNVEGVRTGQKKTGDTNTRTHARTHTCTV